LKNWSEILIKTTDTIEKAVQVLHESGARIVLVVSDDKKLQGTVTDGDVRRALMKKLIMTSKVTKAMNKRPVTAKKSDSHKQVLMTMSNRGLLHMPIVDEDGRLCGLETLQSLIEKPSYDNPVFLMAGGFGTRLYPLTKEMPKPLLNVGNQPILETILLQFVEAGFYNFFISIHFKPEMIRKYFGDGSSWGVNIQYIHEDAPLGTAGSLGLLPDSLPDLPIIIMNGDLLTRVNFENLLDFHDNHNGIATMCIREYDFQVPYGVVEIDDYRITSIKEKPVHKFFVNAGIYVLDRGLIKKVDGKSNLNMPDFLEELGNGCVNAFPIHEYWLDIGHINEYERANQDILDLE
jgi:dTDP-glucose pyrophosphorylase/predicted transcriptional regulator